MIVSPDQLEQILVKAITYQLVFGNSEEDKIKAIAQNCKLIAIDFAKQRVKVALEAASVNAECIDIGDMEYVKMAQLIPQQKPKDLAEWLEKEGLPQTKQILAELKAINSSPQQKRMYSEEEMKLAFKAGMTAQDRVYGEGYENKFLKDKYTFINWLKKDLKFE
jgi:hypothetical protein